MKFLKIFVALFVFCNAASAQTLDVGNIDLSTTAITPDMIRRFQAQREQLRGEPALAEAGDNELAGLQEEFIKNAHYDSLYQYMVLRRFFDRDTLRQRIDRFGENFFLFPMSTFKPTGNLPIPKDYRFGPGDRIDVSIWGDVRRNFNSEIRADGTIMLPYIGRVTAIGMTYDNLRETLIQRYTSVFSTLAQGRPNASSFLDLSISKMRMIKVYVLGEALNPGAYDLHGMSDVYSAIFFSGGPSQEGSFRDIRLVRDGVVLDTIDLYEFVIDGKVNRELRLKDGDIIVYGPRGNLVDIEGAVLRSLKYELKPSETLGDLIRLSGGLRGNAFIDNITISRYIEFLDRADRRDREIVNLTFTNVEEVLNSDFKLRDLDEILVRHLGDDLDNRVAITGSPVRQPGSFGLTQELQTLNDLIAHAGGLREDYYKKASVFRKTPDRELSLLTHNFETDENFALQPDDSVHIFSIHEILIQPSITISGEVNNPQDVPFRVGMRISDAILLAGGVTYHADRGFVEVNRRDDTDVDVFNIVSVVEIDENMNIIDGTDYLLEPQDVVVIRKNPKLLRGAFVHVTGSVLYPGRYHLTSNRETLADIIERAGGVRNDGNIGAATFRRNNHRLSIDIRTALNNPSHRTNILLLSGDSIYVPRMDKTVKVSGEVFFPSKVVWHPGKPASYYIEQAGGLKETGDKRRVVAFKGNGQRAITRACWFDDRLDPGATVYVPARERIDIMAQRIQTLQLIRESFSIIASVASLAVTYFTIQALRADASE